MFAIATIICIGLVLLLLRIEQRAPERVSPAVWIPTLWTLISASRPLTTWFVTAGSTSHNNAEGSLLDRWVLIALAVLALAVLRNRSG